MIVLKALALTIFLLAPGWLAVSLLEGRRRGKDAGEKTDSGGAVEGPSPEGIADGEGILKGREKLFLAAALGTGIVSLCALALALASAYRLWSLLLLVAMVCVALAALGRGNLSWPRRVGRNAYLACLALVAVALILSAPPGRTVFGWSDVGVYADIAAHIDREGAIAMEVQTVREIAPERRYMTYKPNQDPDLPFEAYENKAFAITDFDSGKVIPIFYHLWPSLLAVFASFLGCEEMFWGVTAVAIIGFWGLFELARRLLGWKWALAVAALAGLSPLFQYFSRYGTSEMMNMALFVSGSFCLVSYLENDAAKNGREATRVAIAASFLFSCGFLCRIDFLLVLAPLLLFFAGRKAVRPLTLADGWFCGLTLGGAVIATLVGATLSPVYFNSVVGPLYPRWGMLTSPFWLALLLVAVAFSLSGLLRRWRARMSRLRIPMLILIWAALVAGFVYLYFIRSGYGDNLVEYGVINRIQGPTYNSQILIRWAWYYSFPGLLLALAGYGLWLSRRGMSPGLPVVMTGIAITIVYGLNMRCTPLQILAMRRLIPVIFPISVIMICYCLRSTWAFFASGRSARRSLSLISACFVGAALFYLLVYSAAVSLPLFGLSEGGNQVEVSRQVAEGMEANGILLMDFYLGDLFGPPLRCIHGVENAWLMDNSMLGSEDFSWLLADLGFPERPVYILWRPGMSGKELPCLKNGQRMEMERVLFSSEEALVKTFEKRPARRVYNIEPVWLLRISTQAGSESSD